MSVSWNGAAGAANGSVLDLRKQNFAARPRFILIMKGRGGTAAACTCPAQPLTSVYSVVSAGRRADPADVVWLKLRVFRTGVIVA